MIIVSVFTIVEWFGRNRTNNKVYVEEGRVDEKDGNHVPLLEQE
jgi:hypothetical protein